MILPLLALIGAKDSCAGPAPGAVSATLMREGPALKVAVANGLSEAAFLGGCNAYVLERKSESGWSVARQKTCVWEGIVLAVEPGTSHEASEPLEGLSPGTYRVRADYSLGCKRGEPMSRAGCKSKGVAISDEVTLE